MTTAATTQNRAAYHITKREAMAKLSKMAIDCNAKGLDFDVKLAACDSRGNKDYWFSVAVSNWSKGYDNVEYAHIHIHLPITRGGFESKLAELKEAINVKLLNK